MNSTKNMLNGIIYMIVYLVVTVIVPYLTFSWVRDLTVAGFEITLTQVQYNNIVFWVVAFGLVISGCAFVAYSSPPQTIRRAIFALAQVILNCFYVWSYRFSGALEIEFLVIGQGSVYINLQQMIMVYLGLYFLTIILRVYDIVDFSINRHKIQELKEEKMRAKEEKKRHKEEAKNK